jgi:DNA-binding transcriptional LysR family regulator
VPTDPGARFLTRARRIVHDIDALGRESRALARGESGRLRIGFHSSLADGDLSAALRAYRAAWPDVEIEERERSRDRLLDALESGTLDLAVLSGRSNRPGSTPCASGANLSWQVWPGPPADRA